MTQIIFSDETPKGWIPPSIAAPFICIFLVAVGSLPFDFGFEYLGLTDAKGSPSGPLGLSLLLVSFISFGLLVLGWVHWVEKRSLVSVGFGGAHRLRKFLIGLAVGIAMMGAIVTAIAISGGYRVADVAPAFASPAALGWITLLFASFALQSSVEEFVFRGWLFSTIMRALRNSLEHDCCLHIDVRRFHLSSLLTQNTADDVGHDLRLLDFRLRLGSSFEFDLGGNGLARRLELVWGHRL